MASKENQQIASSSQHSANDENAIGAGGDNVEKDTRNDQKVNISI